MLGRVWYPAACKIPIAMTYEKFKEIWTTLVTNRTPSSDGCAAAVPLNNGVSEHTVDALVAVADGDHSQFDEIEKILAARGEA
jgi:hypothetical protein